MKLRSTTKMALQAALAILITEIINRLFQIDHGYWATLTAMAVTTQTWAENIKRSYERVIMTICGGITGTALFLLLPESQGLTLSLLLVFVFFTVYFLQIHYLMAVFALTCFVVFLFALIGDWTLVLLLDRIMDTLLGVMVAMLVSSFFLPIKTNIDDLFVNFLEKIGKSLNKMFEFQSLDTPHYTSQQLHRDLQKIQSHAQAIRYELILRRGNQKDFHKMLKIIASCTHYTSCLIESFQWLAEGLKDEEKNKLKAAIQTTDQNIQILIGHLKKNEHQNMSPSSDIDELIHSAILENPQHFAQMDNEALGFFNLMYFFARLNKNLNDAY